jgi:hypothetical protein
VCQKEPRLPNAADAGRTQPVMLFANVYSRATSDATCSAVDIAAAALEVWAIPRFS